MIYYYISERNKIMSALTSIIPPPPVINANMLTGTSEQISQTIVDTTNAIIDVIVAPCQAFKNTLDAIVVTADTSYYTAIAAYNTAKLIAKGDSYKLGKAAESALNFRLKMMGFKTRFDLAMSKVDIFANEIKTLVQNIQRHSIDWVVDKINWLLNKINNCVYNALNSIQKKIQNLEDKMREKSQKEAEKLQEDMQKRAQEKAQQQTTNQGKKQQQNEFAQKQLS